MFTVRRENEVRGRADFDTEELVLTAARDLSSTAAIEVPPGESDYRKVASPWSAATTQMSA